MGASHLLVSIGGIKDSTNGQGLPNQQQYKPLAPWGPVSIAAHQVAGESATLKIDNPDDFYKVGELYQGMSVTSSGGDVQDGTTVVSFNAQDDTITLSKPLTPSTGTNTYTFYEAGL